jgi:hypothetical protein
MCIINGGLVLKSKALSLNEQSAKPKTNFFEIPHFAYATSYG